MQGPVSRPNSIANIVSHYAWQQGTETFFRQQVPYSLGTGYVLADALKSVLTSITTPNPTAPLRILEIGAGTGLLSAHLLDLLKSQSADIYTRVSATVTDYSTTLIEEMAQKGLFASHTAKVTAQALPAHSLHITDVSDSSQRSPIDAPHLMIMINTLSALDTVHLHYDGSTLSELLVESNCPDFETTLFDNSKVPPEPLNRDQLIRLDGDLEDSSKLPFPILEALGLNLTETFHHSKSCLPTDDETLIMQWLASRSKPNQEEIANLVFNYPLGLETFLRNALNLLDDNGAFVIGDFGFNGPNPAKESELKTTFGAACAYPIQFDLLKFAAQKAGFQFSITTFPDRQTQYVILQKHGSPPLDAQSLFFNCDATYMETLADTPTELSKYAQEDTVICMQYAQQLLDNGRFEEARKWAQQSLNGYEQCGAPNYSLLARIEAARIDATSDKHKTEKPVMQRYQGALEFYDTALDQNPTLPNLLLEVASFYLAKSELSNAIPYLEKYLLNAPLSHYWQHFCTYILLLANEGESDDALEICRSIITHIDSKKLVIPTEISEKLRLISHELQSHKA